MKGHTIAHIPEWLHIVKLVIKNVGKDSEWQEVSYTACGSGNGYDSVGKLCQYPLKLNIHILNDSEISYLYILQKI